MHEVALSVGYFTRLNRPGQQPSWPTGHRLWPPISVHTPVPAPRIRSEWAEEGTASCSLTLSCSLSLPRLALALSVPQPSSAITAKLYHARSLSSLHLHLIHHAHSYTIISSTSLTHHCHRSSQGIATLCVAVAAMATEHRRALSSPWPAISTAPPTFFSPSPSSS